MGKIAVVALGGNALLKRGEPMTADVQRANVKVAANALAPVSSILSGLVVKGSFFLLFRLWFEWFFPKDLILDTK